MGLLKHARTSYEHLANNRSTSAGIVLILTDEDHETMVVHERR